jgi:hypothetical protein
MLRGRRPSFASVAIDWPFGANSCLPGPKRWVGCHELELAAWRLTPNTERLAASAANELSESSAERLEAFSKPYSLSGWARRNNASRIKYHCERIFRALQKAMRALPSMCPALSLILFLFSCSRSPVADGVYDRDRDGRPDEWVYRLSKTEVKHEFDTNGDGRPDVTKFYKNGQLVRIERDRNFDGQPDLIEEFDHGVIAREIHDDNFDGKPEAIKTFRKGKLAILELDPEERGAIDVAQYYDEEGHMIRRDVRAR